MSDRLSESAADSGASMARRRRRMSIAVKFQVPTMVLCAVAVGVMLGVVLSSASAALEATEVAALEHELDLWRALVQALPPGGEGARLEAVAQTVHPGATGFAFVADAHGGSVVWVGGRDVPGSGEVLKAVLATGRSEGEVALGERRWHFATVADAARGVTIGVGTDPARETAPLRGDIITTTLFVGMALGLMVCVGVVLVARSIGRRIRRVSAALALVEHGDFSHCEGGVCDGSRTSDEVSDCFASLGVVLERLGAFNAENRRLVDEVMAGRLGVSMAGACFEGDYRAMCEGVNAVVAELARPMREAVGVLERLAEGDLRVRMQGDYRGEPAQLAEALERTVVAYDGVVRELQTTAGRIDAAGTDVGASGAQLSRTASALAATVQEIGATIKVISGQVEATAGAAGQAHDLGEGVRARAGEGERAMARLVESMGRIDGSTREVVRVVRIIDEIAFQTNLLALNAAVEAARAGVHGKGFAVVAEEVRNLAARSAEAARETAAMVRTTRDEVEQGTALARATARVFGTVSAGVADMSGRVSDVSGASAHESEAVRQIDQGMDGISAAMIDNQRMSHDALASSEDLRAAATGLVAIVGRFRLRDGPRVSSRRDGHRSAGNPLAAVPTRGAARAHDVHGSWG